MRIGRTHIDNKSLFIGMGAFLVLLCLPFVSEPLTKVVTSIRDKVSGIINKK